MVFPKFILNLAFFAFLFSSINLVAAQEKHEENNKNQRIITLSPHLTEIVFALGKGAQIVGVSDFSDYPVRASLIESVASFEGANIAQIIRLKPTHILAWRGGNKDADIAKLKALQVNVYESNVTSITALINDIIGIGKLLNVQNEAHNLVDQMQSTLNLIEERYRTQSKSAVYYLSTQPLIGLGNDRWLNSLLTLCGINNLYKNSTAAFPQFKLSHIIRQQPDVIIDASKSSITDLENYWRPYKKVIDSKLISANPDALHRFTPRALDEMGRICHIVHSN